MTISSGFSGPDCVCYFEPEWMSRQEVSVDEPLSERVSEFRSVRFIARDVPAADAFAWVLIRESEIDTLALFSPGPYPSVLSSLATFSLVPTLYLSRNRSRDFFTPLFHSYFSEEKFGFDRSPSPPPPSLLDVNLKSPAFPSVLS